jgi:hypothetical protein
MKQIQLTQNKIALVDDEDFEYLSSWRWHIVKSGKHTYAGRQPDKIMMHRIIMHTPPYLEVDHIDRNGLNNQKYNLRNCTRSQNMGNQCTQAKYKGVYLPRNNHYRSVITVNKQHIHLGTFDTAEQAAKAYNDAALFYFKEFAYLNTIKDERRFSFLDDPDGVKERLLRALNY